MSAPVAEAAPLPFVQCAGTLDISKYCNEIFVFIAIYYPLRLFQKSVLNLATLISKTAAFLPSSSRHNFSCIIT